MGERERESSGSLLGIFLESSGNLLGISWGSSGNLLGISWAPVNTKVEWLGHFGRQNRYFGEQNRSQRGLGAISGRLGIFVGARDRLRRNLDRCGLHFLGEFGPLLVSECELFLGCIFHTCFEIEF